MEPFNLDNDYEEGHFDEETGEFYFESEKRVKRQKMTKEDHIYGDFIGKSDFDKRNFGRTGLLGDEDDEDEYGDE